MLQKHDRSLSKTGKGKKEWRHKSEQKTAAAYSGPDFLSDLQM